MSPIALSDNELADVMAAARLVTFDLRQAYLEQVAVKLRGKDQVPVSSIVLPSRSRAVSHGTLSARQQPRRRVTMILVEQYLLPPGRTEEKRLAIVRERVRKRRGVSGRVIAVFPGEDGWVRQLGNKDGIVYFGVVERQCSPSLPRPSHRRASW